MKRSQKYRNNRTKKKQNKATEEQKNLVRIYMFSLSHSLLFGNDKDEANIML